MCESSFAPGADDGSVRPLTWPERRRATTRHGRALPTLMGNGNLSRRRSFASAFGQKKCPVHRGVVNRAVGSCAATTLCPRRGSAGGSRLRPTARTAGHALLASATLLRSLGCRVDEQPNTVSSRPFSSRPASWRMPSWRYSLEWRSCAVAGVPATLIGLSRLRWQRTVAFSLTAPPIRSSRSITNLYWLV